MQCLFVFVRFCNLSLRLGVFPSEFKIARLTIRPKKGDLRRLDNLRPISILIILGKVLEKIVKLQVVHYFESNDLFYLYQFGFRKARSTSGAVFCLTD